MAGVGQQGPPQNEANTTVRSGFGVWARDNAPKGGSFHISGDALTLGGQDPKSSFFGQRTSQGAAGKPPLLVNRQAQGPGLKKPFQGFGGPNAQRRHSAAQTRMNVKKSLSMPRGRNSGRGGIEANITNSLLKPQKDNSANGNNLDFQLNGVNLFGKQASDVRPQNEPDPRDEYWRQNFINYDTWKKEDQAIHKNRKMQRPPSKSKLNARAMQEQMASNDDLLPQIQEAPQVREQMEQPPPIIDLEIIQEYQRQKKNRQQRSVPKPPGMTGPAPSSGFGQQAYHPPLLANIKRNDVGQNILTKGKPVVESESRFTAAIHRMNLNQ